MSDRYIPVTYEPKKANKSKVDYKNLYKTDLLSFDPLIGYITNVSTTLYEIQSQFEKGSPEYEELDRRLKLCCYYQSAAIDSAKGIAFEGIPKHWVKRTKVTDDMAKEETEAAALNNRICIGNKRPYFMRYLYRKRNKEYRNFLSDLRRISVVFCGKPYDETFPSAELPEIISKKIAHFADIGNPLIETNGTMNRVCRYMEKRLSKKQDRTNSPKKENADHLFEILYDNSYQTDFDLLPKMNALKSKYINFKKSKRLSDSDFNTYEQLYQSIFDEAVETISNNETELANLAVMACYTGTNKSKDFCWDCFGEAIFRNVLRNKGKSVCKSDYMNALQVTKADEYMFDYFPDAKFCRIGMPVADETGEITYLGKRYKIEYAIIGDSNLQ